MPETDVQRSVWAPVPKTHAGNAISIPRACNGLFSLFPSPLAALYERASSMISTPPPGAQDTRRVTDLLPRWQADPSDPQSLRGSIRSVAAEWPTRYMCNRHKNLQKRISTRTRSLTTYLDALSMQNRPLQNLLDEMAPRAMTMPTRTRFLAVRALRGSIETLGRDWRHLTARYKVRARCWMVKRCATHLCPQTLHDAAQPATTGRGATAATPTDSDERSECAVYPS